MRTVLFCILIGVLLVLASVNNPSSLDRRIERLEAIVKPLAIHQKLVCDGKSDDFYEEFYRTIAEQCEGKK